ncbi:MAG: dimethylargininase [Proteobacteria bacterium]|nr:dimethylargininase [Pseudomonadota bacterium]
MLHAARLPAWRWPCGVAPGTLPASPTRKDTTIARIAITRAVSPALAHCELSHLPRTPIDLDLARRQHAAYEQALRDVGCEVRQLAEQPAQPDSVFVEDTAIVLDEVAVITRPGAVSRRGEVDSIAPALAAFRELLRIEAPATLDGGDVLRLDRVLHVGASARSNADGVAQLARLVAPFGYAVEAVPIRGCLHLKSAVTRIDADRLLLNPDWVDAGAFPGFHGIAIDPAEPNAANALRIGGALIHPASCPRTHDILRRAGLDVRSVQMSETEKAEGGVTCCSLVFDA